jgi:hypothetical protein
MMTDFHDIAQRAGEALAAATTVEAEVRSTRGGPSRVDRLLHRQRTEGVRPVGLRFSLSDTPPPPAELAARGHDRHPRDPLMYPTHHTRAA